MYDLIKSQVSECITSCDTFDYKIGCHKKMGQKSVKTMSLRLSGLDRNGQVRQLQKKRKKHSTSFTGFIEPGCGTSILPFYIFCHLFVFVGTQPFGCVVNFLSSCKHRSSLRKEVRVNIFSFIFAYLIY